MAATGSRKRSVTEKTQFVEPPRHNAPRGIAALLAPVLRPVLAKRGTALATLISDWPGIVGPDVAARSVPVKFAAGTLTVGCAGPDALAFQHLAPTLIGRINTALGGAPVQRLRFADLPVVAQPRPSRPVQRSIVANEPPSLPDGPIGEALARLHAGLGRSADTRKN